MCDRRLKRAVGLGCVAVGLGILLTYLFRGVLLTTVAAIALSVAGVMLLKSS